MQFWWSLRREPTTLRLPSNSVDLQNIPRGAGNSRMIVRERVYASVKVDNEASQRVLKKAGFEFVYYNEMDGQTYWRMIRDT